MLEAVLHVLECFLGEDFGLFGVGLVVELAGVAERNLFVPPLLAHRLLAFEGVEGRNVEETFGRAIESVPLCEFCETDMLAERENGVPSQLFE